MVKWEWKSLMVRWGLSLTLKLLLVTAHKVLAASVMLFQASLENAADCPPPIVWLWEKAGTALTPDQFE